ncbi:MAG TPA: hypothetical protein PLK12_06025 [Prolixibacteraceae bacterium]|nr:hypothetical protein [Prolixibacteraceae bacterium]
MMEIVHSERIVERRKAAMFILIGATIIAWGILISSFYFIFNGIF